MKNNKIYKGLAAIAFAAMLTGCSSDYLDIDPVTNMSEETALGSAGGAEMAMQGIIEAMNKQYGNLDWNGNCGEAYVGNVLNDALGPDLVSGLWGNYNGFGNWQLLDSEYSYATLIGWNYYYTLISEANKIIAAVKVDEAAAGDEDTGNEVESEETASLKFSLAQALTIRAHAYQKLMGLYAPRFEDSKNGEAYTIVLRTEPTYDDVPLAKYKDVIAQIYKDLDRALNLYDESGMTRANKTTVDASVAHGIYARTAIANHDWSLAQQHAAAARASYTVMDADTYLSGFTDDCSDYIWHMDPKFETTYYWSWGSHNCCNGGYVSAWAFGAGAINIDLYRLTDAKDIRRQLYLTPDKVKGLASAMNPGKVKEADFWNENMLDATDVFINLASTNIYKKNDAEAPGMYNVVAWWCYNYLTKTFKGDPERFKADDKFYNYFYLNTKEEKKTKDMMVKRGQYVRLVKTPFGAQTKFWGDIPYGNMSYPWMRASEMALTEAEAYYEMGNETNAKKCLTEVMKNRVTGYTCKTSGDALREEIRVNRRMELFMEGQNFTDFKRWNVSVERRAWVKNDPTSGNAVGFQVMPERTPDAANGWVWPIPYRETQFNKAVDLTLLNK